MKQLSMFPEYSPAFEPPDPGALVVSYGAGVDSTALLVEFVRRYRAGDARYRPAQIVFADTGGERPETYDYLAYFSNWLRGAGFPRVTTVRSTGRDATLEDKCLRLSTLPAIAFGWKTCSDNFKRQPITRHLRRLHGKALSDVVCVIGFEAGEGRRIASGVGAADKYQRAFPLAAWGWDRADCAREIAREGLPVPPKSACFFCPSSKRPEVLALAQNHPDLAARAIRMEAGATKAVKVPGLGRNYAWTPVLLAANAGIEAHLTEVRP